MYISVGDRVRPPSKGYITPSALGEERVGVIDFGFWAFTVDYTIRCGMYVPGSRYLYMFYSGTGSASSLPSQYTHK